MNVYYTVMFEWQPIRLLHQLRYGKRFDQSRFRTNVKQYDLRYCSNMAGNSKKIFEYKNIVTISQRYRNRIVAVS